VASDQLKLRAGLVRCGACEEVFNALDHLLPENTSTPDNQAAPDTPEVQASSADALIDHPMPLAIDTLSENLNFSNDDEPSFVLDARRTKRIARISRIALITGSLVLGIGALLQSLYTFPDQLAVAVPQARPFLLESCALLNCRLDMAAQINALNVEAVEMQPLATPKDSFMLTVLLRNRSNKIQTWPHVELSLNDSDDKTVARKIFKPEHYLKSPSDVDQGIAANSEQSVKLNFETRLFKPEGYRVILFYP
jgi:hypothetical protein